MNESQFRIRVQIIGLMSAKIAREARMVRRMFFILTNAQRSPRSGARAAVIEHGSRSQGLAATHFFFQRV